MIVRVFLALGFLVAIAFGALRAELGRQLLWLTVQSCALDHRLLHAAFPCIEVETGHGAGSFAILRSPFDKSHIVLTPTIEIVGIETPVLRRADAPPFLDLAWSRRRLAYPAKTSAVPDVDMGLAINSQRGRTQDQLHVHIDCLLDDVRTRLNAVQLPPPGQWSLAQLDDGAPYSITKLGSSLKGGSNAIDIAARHLNLGRATMPSLTIAIAIRQTGPHGSLGFVLLARQDQYRQHAELLLDHDCKHYGR